MRIYVCGPIAPRGAGDMNAARVEHQNVMKAIMVGIKIIERGHNPYIPHLSHFLNIEASEGFSHETWMRLDQEWLERCEALFFIAPSKGASAELEFAQRQGMKVFYSLEDVPVSKGKQ